MPSSVSTLTNTHVRMLGSIDVTNVLTSTTFMQRAAEYTGPAVPRPDVVLDEATLRQIHAATRRRSHERRPRAARFAARRPRRLLRLRPDRRGLGLPDAVDGRARPRERPFHEGVPR